MNDPMNPYSSPMSGTLESNRYEQLETAGKGRRFLTYVVDYLGFVFTAFIAGIFIALAGGADWMEHMNKGMEYLFTIGVMLAYYISFEALFGRTPGKFVCGTRVVDEKGGPPSFGQVVGRSFARFIPFEPFSLLFGSEAIGWHDSLPKTRVVLAKKQ